MAQHYDHIGAIIAFESGELDDEGIIELFQYLLDSGLAFNLQGSYGRMTIHLLNEGLIVDVYGESCPGLTLSRDDEILDPDDDEDE